MFWKRKTAQPPKAVVTESTITTAVHALELGAWAKYIKGFLFALCIFVLLLIYQSNQFRGLEMAEAMDQAQIGRNLARGEGFTTRFIRPVAAYMFRENREYKTAMPDLSNPPLFPLALAAAFKLRPPDFEVKTTQAMLYTRYPPDTYVVAVAEIFFLGSAVLLYLLGRQLFDKRTAFIALLMFLFSDLLWRYSIAGLSNTLAMFLFLGAQLCIVNAQLAVGRQQPPWLIWLLCAATGLLCGLCLLTKYSAGWLILPVLAYAGLTLGRQRWAGLALIGVVFLLVIAPWLWRNDRLCGKWFGLAAYSLVEQTERYPGDSFQRSYKAASDTRAKHAQKKMLGQLRRFSETGWLRTGAGLVVVFFLASTLYRFKKPEVLHFRRFVLGAGALAVLVGSCGSSISSTKEFVTDPDNLALLLCPGIILVGVSFFFLLFDRVQIRYALLKHAAVGLFVVLCAAPLIFSLLPPRRHVIRYPNPPYFEPIISAVSRSLDPTELMLTDMPWAVAWYGNRKAMWLPLISDPKDFSEFFAINDFYQRFGGLYLTPMTWDRRLLSEVFRGDARPWLPLFFGQSPHKEFTLTTPVRIGFEPEQVFFSDRPRNLEEKR